MAMRNKIYMMLVAALLVAGCEKEIPLDADGIEPKVVVNGTVEEGSPLNVRLTYSRLIFGWHDADEDYTFDVINNATMAVKVNGTEYSGTLAPDSGDYQFAYIPQEGDKIDLTVKVPGHEDLTASTVVPRKPVLSDMRASQRNTGDQEVQIDVRFKLTDPASETNYYRMRVYMYDTVVYRYADYNGDTVTEVYGGEPLRISFSCNDAAISPMGINDISIDEDVTYGTLFFTDNALNGETHEIHMNFLQWNGGYWEKDDVTTHKYVEVEIVGMTRDRFLYEQSIDAAGQEDDLGLFQEPVQVHCNIEGGIGIFAGTAAGRLKAEIAE